MAMLGLENIGATFDKLDMPAYKSPYRHRTITLLKGSGFLVGVLMSCFNVSTQGGEPCGLPPVAGTLLLTPFFFTQLRMAAKATVSDRESAAVAGIEFPPFPNGVVIRSCSKKEAQ